MLTVEQIAKTGTAFVSEGTWYNLDRGTPPPPIGAVVEGHVVESVGKNGQPRYTIYGLTVVGQGAPKPAYQPKQGYQAKPAYQGGSKGGYNSNNSRGNYDTSTEQKLRYNALMVAVELNKQGSAEQTINMASEFYKVIKDGFDQGGMVVAAPVQPAQPVYTAAIPAAAPVQQAKVPPHKRKAAVPPSAFQQPDFSTDDLPFDAQ